MSGEFFKMIYWLIVTLLNTCLLLNFSIAEDPKVTALFDDYKKKFKRVYKNKATEAEGFHNFKLNLKKVNELNAVDVFHPTYELNRYADLNPSTISQDFQVDIKPYSYIKNRTKHILKGEMGPRLVPSVEDEIPSKDGSLYKTWFKKMEEMKFSPKYDHAVNNYNILKQVAGLKTTVGRTLDFDARLSGESLSNNGNSSATVGNDNVNEADIMKFEDLLRRIRRF